MSAFFSDHGVRETIESILVAIILAFLFKTFQAEAFVIPTGSMAPTLRGEHYDVQCGQCEHRFQTGYFPEARVTRIYCPMCRFPHRLDPRDNADDNPFDGDRILVNKFLFDFAEPQRWDVIVFKNPQERQTELHQAVGRTAARWPADRSGRPVHVRPAKRIVRQPADRTQNAAQKPGRWRSWLTTRVSSAASCKPPNGRAAGRSGAAAMGRGRSTAKKEKTPTPSKPKRTVRCAGSAIAISSPPPPIGINSREAICPSGSGSRTSRPLSGLILDHYSYNDSNSARLNRPGIHWVGDVGFEVQLEIASDSGTIALDTVEGGVHLQCAIDVASGEARVTASGSSVTLLSPAGEAVAEASGSTRIRGRGTHRLRWMNADDRLFLWVDDRAVNFHRQPFVDFRRDGDVVPRWSDDDPGDAQPLGLGCRGAALRVLRLKVFRDVYYASIREQRRPFEYRLNADFEQVLAILNDPTRWSTPAAEALFASRTHGRRPV